MRSEAHTYFRTAELQVPGTAWCKAKSLFSEWRLERLRKQALADVIAKGDYRLLKDAGIDPENLPNHGLGMPDKEMIFGNRL